VIRAKLLVYDAQVSEKMGTSPSQRMGVSSLQVKGLYVGRVCMECIIDSMMLRAGQPVEKFISRAAATKKIAPAAAELQVEPSAALQAQKASRSVLATLLVNRIYRVV